MSTYPKDQDKIDSLATNGLLGTSNSLAYRVHEIEKHFHNSELWYGYTAPNMARGVLTAFQVTAGNAVYGTNGLIHDGTVLSAIAGAVKFDFNKMRVSAVGNANRLTFVEWWGGSKGTPVAATTQDAGNTITKATHGLVADDRVFLTALATSGGIDLNTVYYVYNVVGDTFQVSLTASTNSPAAVGITGGDGTCSYSKIGSPAVIMEAYVSRTSTTPDTSVVSMMMSRQPVGDVFWHRAKASGGTNTVDYFFGLHTYTG